MVFNTLEELIIALKEGVFENDEFLTTSQGIQNNDVSLAETLWAKVVENTTQGTQDPNGNVTADEIGRFYIRTDVSPKHVYISNAATDSDWIRLNETASTGNGIANNSGILNLANLTSNTSISAEEFTFLFDNFASYEIKAKSSTIDSDGAGSLSLTKGTAKVKGESQDGTTYSEAYANKVGGAGIKATNGTTSSSVTSDELGNAVMTANNGSGESSVSVTDGKVKIKNQDLKGPINTLEPINLDWSVDDRVLPDVGVIKKNLRSFISSYTNIDSVVANPVSSNVFVPYTISLNTNASTKYKLAINGTPSTTAYAYTYEVDITANANDIGKHIIVDFVGCIGCPKVKLNGVDNKIISQNASYIISYNGTDLVYEKLSEPKTVVSNNSGPSYNFGPGKYIVPGSLSSVTIEDSANLLDGEEIEIVITKASDINSTTFNMSGSDTRNTLVMPSVHNKMILTRSGTVWYSHN